MDWLNGTDTLSRLAAIIKKAWDSGHCMMPEASLNAIPIRLFQALIDCATTPSRQSPSFEEPPTVGDPPSVQTNIG